MDEVIKLNPLISKETLNRFIEFEGKVNHFYLDGPGNVTIGIGCLIPDSKAATVLNMFYKANNLKAKPLDITNEFLAVKSQIAGHSSVYYDKFCTLYINDTQIISLFEFRIENFISNLRHQFPYFDSLPFEVKDVILDMAFNLGIYGLLTKFLRFMSAINQGKWDVAARESHRNGISGARNAWTFETLNNLSSNQNYDKNGDLI